jgi:hypothetical protein
MAIGGAGQKLMRSGTLTNAGTATWSGTGDVLVANGAVWNNQAGATFEIQNDRSILWWFNALPTFNNAGTVLRSTSTGTAAIGIAFNNTGKVEVRTGTLRFTSSFTQTAGTTLLNGGALTSTTTLNVQGGSLAGAGSVAANVTLAGRLSPGVAPGGAATLALSGTYAQTAAGAFDVEIGGYLAGSQFDEVTVTGSATLAGALDVSLLGGFVPNVGDTFRILTVGSRAGTFSTLNHVSTGGVVFDVTYGATTATLVVVSVPASAAGAGEHADRQAPRTATATGTVFFSDGVTPVPFPSVFVTQTVAGVTRTLFARATDAKGHYSVPGVGAGAFAVIAQDTDSGSSATVQGTRTDSPAALAVDVRLQPSGRVTGTVLDAEGTPVPFAELALSSAGAALVRLDRADSRGVYRFDRTALGAFLVQAGDPETGLFATATGELGAQGEAVADAVLPAAGTVSGTVFGVDGTPVASADVALEDRSRGGPLGFFGTSTSADGSGRYEATGVPVGTVRVTASDPIDGSLAGSAVGTLTPEAPATLDVTLGAGAQPTLDLYGKDGFRYDVDCDGRLMEGGTTDGRQGDAYDGTYRLSVGGEPLRFPCLGPTRLEAGGRQGVLGPAPMSGLEVTRKVFSPAGGRFVRYLEILSNPSPAPAEVVVEVRSDLGSDGSTRIVLGAESTGRTFVVTDAQGSCCDPALAHVFGGPGARLAIDEARFENDRVLYRWTVTVPAGQTAILMHFAVQSETPEAAQAGAAALALLTHPGALAGLSRDEKAQVVNFRIPRREGER